MAHPGRFGLTLAALVAVVLAPAAHSQSASPVSTCAAAQSTAAKTSRITADWHAGAWASVPGSKPAAPRNGLDLGLAPAGTKLDRMLLLLTQSDMQAKALDDLLSAQQTPGSCQFHRWLKPAQFADSFANSKSDVEEVATWLASQGFTVAPLPSGRGWIEFSGTAGQVQQAFQVPVRTYRTPQGERYVLGGDIAVPDALRGLVRGLVSLDGVVSAPALTKLYAVNTPASVLASATDLSAAQAITPKIAVQMLHLDSAATGSGESIAIAARGSVDAGDVAAFRVAFGLPANPLAGGSAQIQGSEADRAMATMAAEWAGAAAPSAKVMVAPVANTLATDGLDLSLASLVDENTAQTLLVGNQACEAAMSDAHRAFYAAVYRQAAAEGISVIAAAGDAGAAACFVPGVDEEVTTGYAVNGLASTEWNTAVGASALKSNDGTMVAAWSQSSPADEAYAGGGGTSSVHSLPQWQPVLAGAHESNGRQLPDVAFPTALESAMSKGLVFCFGGTSGCNAMRAGGSSAATAIFGGVSAVLAQKYGAQGNLAPRLYELNGTSAFADVQQGSASLACASGTPGCDGSGEIGYAAVAGYDLATGLGVPNAEKLISVWPNYQAMGSAAATVTLAVSPINANAKYNPSASITFTANVSGGGAMPTGTVQFSDTSQGSILGFGNLNNGVATYAMSGGWAIGGHNIVAHYNGDTNYATADSSSASITIQQSTTSLAVTPSTTTPIAGSSVTATVTLTVGTPPAGATAPSGSVTMKLDGVVTSTTSLTTSNNTSSASFTVTIPSGGTHTLQAEYAGDANYSGSTSPSVSLTASKGATVTTLTATPTTLTAGTPETLTATVAPSNATTGSTYSITGTVAFYDGTTLLGSATLNSNTATLSSVTLSTTTTHLITAVYSGDTSWATSTSNAVTLKAVLIADTVALTANPMSAGPGQVITFVATVTPATAPATSQEQNPTGNVVFYNGTAILATVALSAGPNNTGVAQLLNATLPAGQNSISAFYVGDSYYAAGTSNTVVVTVQDFSIAPSSGNPPTNLNILKGQAGTASFVVSGLGGYNQQIQVVCAVPSTDYMTCTPSPQQVLPTGTVSFTVTTFTTGGPTTGALKKQSEPWWPGAAGGTALATLLFLVLPIGRKARWLTERSRKVMGIALLLIGVGATGVGCSSVSKPVTGTGTPLGVATLKITATAYVDNTVVSHSVYLTVNVLPPS